MPLVEAVQTDVDAVDAHTDQVRKRFGQQKAIRRQGHGTDAVHFFQGLHEGHGSLSHQRFAARNLEAVDTQGQGSPADEQHFFIAQDRVVADAGQGFGHAVTAAEIAAVRQGQAQVVDGPPPLILHSAPLRHIGNDRSCRRFFRRGGYP